MRIGMIGLGRMGANMTTRLLRGGHEVVVYDRSADAVRTAAAGGAVAADSLEGLVAALADAAAGAGDAAGVRVVWVMVPAGDPTESTVQALAALLGQGDVVVDGGNSNYKDSVRRAATLAERGILMVDAGTSGGIWGLAEGYSLMVGGDARAVALLRPAIETLAPAPDRGWGHVGPAGAGHFTKMIHNGIEYGMMQAFAEGFSILEHKREFDIDLAARALAEDATLDGIAPFVSDSGEGRWTVAEAIDLDVPAPVITLSLLARLRSRQEDSFSAKVIAALRNEFGGHAVKST